MAIQNNGIFGAWRGKVGNLVGSSIFGKATIRTYQPNVLNPRSAGQIAQRTAFNACRILGTEINSTMLIPLVKRFTKGMSQLNRFIQLNVGYFASTGVPVFSSLIISLGKLLPFSFGSCSITGTTLNVVQQVVVDPFGLDSDRIYLLLVEKTANAQGTYDVLFSGYTGETRDSGNFSVTIARATTSDCALYVSYMRADGSLVSNSSYYDLTV